MTRLKIIFSAVFLGGMLLGLTLSAEEAADGIREERRSSGIYWTANFNYDGASLRLSTPSGEVQEQSFDGRRSLELNTTGLEDGLYVFELSFRAILSPELREAIESRSREASTTDSGLEKEIRDRRLHSRSGAFRIDGGLLVMDHGVEGKTVARTSDFHGASPAIAENSKGEVIDDTDGGTRDQTILDDLIVDGSACVGLDCVNGESFGFDTLRLKENNLRIKFQDTSNSASFPTNDWQLTANDSSNGGQNKFSIDDIDGGRTPFTIEASAPSNSLYVDDGGRIGLGTATPVVEVHTVDGDTPTLRLEQNGSSGFTAQTWDLAGNETNFFIRDVTNGSTLPFRIRPGAPTSSIDIAASGDIGIGTASPGAAMHVYGTDGNTQLKVEEASPTSAGRTMLHLANNGVVKLKLENSRASAPWNIVARTDGKIYFNDESDASQELEISPDGDLTIAGTLTVRNGQADQTTYPDFVFQPDYKLMELGELSDFVSTHRHLPEIPSAAAMSSEGINMTQMQISLLKKVEELTLYIIQQDERLSQQQQEMRKLKEQLAGSHLD